LAILLHAVLAAVSIGEVGLGLGVGSRVVLLHLLTHLFHPTQVKRVPE